MPGIPEPAFPFLTEANAAELKDQLDPVQPLEVEIGCGLGDFLLARARKCPGTQFVGIERMLDRIRRSHRKIRRAGLSNVRLWRIEALCALQFVLPPCRIDVVYIFFPDPWPKRRHHKRRLIGPAFPDMLAHRLKPGGQVFMTTDDADYHRVIRDRFRSSRQYREIPPWPREPDEQTRFEQIFKGQNHPIYECGFASRVR